MEARRVYLAWEPRPDRVPALATRLLSAMDWLRTLPELDGEWAAIAPRTQARLPCASPGSAARCLAMGGYPLAPWPRSSEPEYCKQTFYQGSLHRWTAKLTIVGGVRAVTYGIQAPNRFDLLVRAGLSPLALRQILLGLLPVFRPAWGFGASERSPLGPSPESAVPAAGWLTYLSDWFGPPPALPAPALVSRIAGFGTLIQASPGAFEPGDPQHRARIRPLEEALRASGMLRPYTAPAP